MIKKHTQTQPCEKVCIHRVQTGKAQLPKIIVKTKYMYERNPIPDKVCEINLK